MARSASLRRIEARDRRMAAIHEAGHVTMARNVGLDILAAWLEKTPDPGVYDKLWIGHTRPYLKKKMSREKLAMFAVAGAVAECCWHRDSFDEMLDNDAWYDAAAMSDSDWACCRCEPGNPTPRLLKIIKTVFSLFDRQAGKLWPDLLVEARRLIEHSREPAYKPRVSVKNE
jgi:hypothetical protein